MLPCVKIFLFGKNMTICFLMIPNFALCTNFLKEVLNITNRFKSRGDKIKSNVIMVIVINIILLGTSMLAGMNTTFPECKRVLYTRYSLSQNEEYDMAVIAPEIFSSSLQPLIEHKNNRGLSTKLVTLGKIYNGTYFPAHGRDNQEKSSILLKMQ